MSKWFVIVFVSGHCLRGEKASMNLILIVFYHSFQSERHHFRYKGTNSEKITVSETLNIDKKRLLTSFTPVMSINS